MTLVSCIRKLINDACCVNRISKGSGKNKQSINLGSEKPEYLIIDFDSPYWPIPKTQKRPDFLFVSDTGGKENSMQKGFGGRIIPIEISSGRKTATEIKDQLQAGANWVARGLEIDQDPKLIPVYLGKMKKIERNKLKKLGWKIKFNNISVFVETISTGDKFPDPK